MGQPLAGKMISDMRLLVTIAKTVFKVNTRDWILFWGDRSREFGHRLLLAIKTVLDRRSLQGIRSRIRPQRGLFDPQGRLFALLPYRPWGYGRLSFGRIIYIPILKAKTPKVLGRPGLWFPCPRARRWYRRAFVAPIRDVWCSDLGLVFSPEGRAVYQVWHPRKKRHHMVRAWFWGVAPASRRITRKEAPVIEEAIILVQNDDKVYGHFLLEVLSRIALVEPRLRKRLPVYASTRHVSYRQALACAGVDESRIVSSEEAPLIYCRRAVIPCYGLGNYLGLHPLFKEHYQRIKEKALALAKPREYPAKIFISRRGFNQRLDEELFRPLLEEQGFTVVRPQEHSFYDQAAFFHHASLVVGATGSGILNVILCRPGTKVVELRPAGNQYDTQALCHANGLDYVVIKGNYGRRYRPSQYQSFTVETADLLQALSL